MDGVVIGMGMFGRMKVGMYGGMRTILNRCLLYFPYHLHDHCSVRCFPNRISQLGGGFHPIHPSHPSLPSGQEGLMRACYAASLSAGRVWSPWTTCCNFLLKGYSSRPSESLGIRPGCNICGNLALDCDVEDRSQKREVRG